MPQKTKREKIIADERREHTPSHFQFTAQITETAQPPIARHLNGDLARIQKDLLKTVMLAILAITSELVLSKILK